MTEKLINKTGLEEFSKKIKEKAVFISDTSVGEPSIFDLVYPVGSIYMSATMSTVAQVQAAFGGTWIAWGSGKVPVGVNTSDTDFNAVEKTGGYKTHYHSLPIGDEPNGNGMSVLDTNYFHSKTGSDIYPPPAANNWKFNLDGSVGTPSMLRQWGTADGNTLQPYITCYMYKRTA